jgi:hypothetical protein
MANGVVTISFTADSEVPQDLKAALQKALAAELLVKASELSVRVSNIVVTVL